MKDVIRIVLVDPDEESRTSLQRLLGGITSVWLSEVLSSYEGAMTRAKDIVAHITIIVLDHDPNQSIELIQKLNHLDAAAVVPASRSSDSGLILKAIRAGAREFLTLPADPAELLEIISRFARGRSESKTTDEQGPRIITVAGRGRGRRLHDPRRQCSGRSCRHQRTGNHFARPRPAFWIGRRLPGHHPGPHPRSSASEL